MKIKTLALFGFLTLGTLFSHASDLRPFTYIDGKNVKLFIYPDEWNREDTEKMLHCKKIVHQHTVRYIDGPNRVVLTVVSRDKTGEFTRLMFPESYFDEAESKYYEATGLKELPECDDFETSKSREWGKW